jgi:beta-N-acetylhexosaminidase
LNSAVGKLQRPSVTLALISALVVVLSSCQPVPQETPRKPQAPVIYSPPVIEPWGSNPVDFYAREYVATLTLEQQIRSLLILHFPGTDPATLQNFLNTHQPSGLIFMRNNIPATAEELSALTSSLTALPEFPPLFAIDEEGGEVTRLPYDTFPGANVLRFEAPEQTHRAFEGRGQLLESVGLNLNFGVVADVSSDPRSFIYSRSFGADAQAASERVRAAVEGESTYVLSTLKHYPGHGSAPGDSHFSIPVSGLDKETWVNGDGSVFATGISAGAEVVMFGHLSFPAIDPAPASLSATWHDILTEEQNFTGISITDDMLMLERSQNPEYANRAENAVRALEAGNDVLLYVGPSTFDPNEVVAALLQAVESGRISENQVKESAIKIATLRRSLYSEAENWIPPCDLRCFVWVTY